jgi:hypothetical protein
MYTGLNKKYPLFSPDFNETNFLERFLKNTQISNLIKFCPMGTKLFHAVGQRQTYTTKEMVTFHNFLNDPKKMFSIINNNTSFILACIPHTDTFRH